MMYDGRRRESRRCEFPFEAGGTHAILDRWRHSPPLWCLWGVGFSIVPRDWSPNLGEDIFPPHDPQ